MHLFVTMTLHLFYYLINLYICNYQLLYICSTRGEVGRFGVEAFVLPLGLWTQLSFPSWVGPAQQDTGEQSVRLGRESEQGGLHMGVEGQTEGQELSVKGNDCLL